MLTKQEKIVSLHFTLNIKVIITIPKVQKCTTKKGNFNLAEEKFEESSSGLGFEKSPEVEEVNTFLRG
jgi:hypothetical protein